MPDVFLKEGLFHKPDSAGDQPYLIGSRCKVCGYTCFPPKKVCVRCRRDGTMAEKKLDPVAELETFAVMQVGPPEYPPPYIIGYVTTRDGALVFTLITGCEPRDDALHLGEEMELVIEKIKQDEKGNNVIGWKFKPVRSGK